MSRLAKTVTSSMVLDSFTPRQIIIVAKKTNVKAKRSGSSESAGACQRPNESSKNLYTEPLERKLMYSLQADARDAADRTYSVIIHQPVTKAQISPMPTYV